MTIQSLRAFIDHHGPSAAALSAVTAALDARGSGVDLDPVLEARIRELLAVLGASDVLDDVRPEEAAGMAGLLRAFAAMDRKLHYVRTCTRAWDFADTDVLQGIGAVARGHAHEITRAIVPSLDGMEERLRSPGAAFLDIGVGVGGLAIALAQMWPELHIVGIDPWQPSLSLARENVDAANLGDRIELREQVGEALEDVDAFDLAWLPFPFIPELAIGPTCERTLRALRPGGWIIVSMSGHATLEPLPAASMRLRLTLCGGPDWSSEQSESLLRDRGFVEVRTLPTVPGSVVSNVVGRRPG